jgi:hypothetical protein
MYSTSPDLPRTSLIGLFAAGFEAVFGAAFLAVFLVAIIFPLLRLVSTYGNDLCDSVIVRYTKCKAKQQGSAAKWHF